MFDFLKRKKLSQEEIIQIVIDSDRGDAQALALLQGLYKSTKMTDTRRNNIRREVYTPRAKQGELEAQLWMGRLSVIDDDSEGAEHWFSMAAEQNDTQAMLQLAIGYSPYNACSFGEDAEKSFYWLEKAANLGNPDAQCQVAMEYASGDLVEQNHEVAYQWYLKAATQEYPESFLCLGELCADNQPWNTHYDREMSHGYLMRAMESRVPEICRRAASLLALHYGAAVLQNGETTIAEDDAQLTIYWLCQSFWFGNREAHEQLEEVMALSGLSVSKEESLVWRYDYRDVEDED